MVIIQDKIVIVIIIVIVVVVVVGFQNLIFYGQEPWWRIYYHSLWNFQWAAPRCSRTQQATDNGVRDCTQLTGRYQPPCTGQDIPRATCAMQMSATHHECSKRDAIPETYERYATALHMCPLTVVVILHLLL